MGYRRYWPTTCHGVTVKVFDIIGLKLLSGTRRQFRAGNFEIRRLKRESSDEDRFLFQ
jgi:hypothetical protein